MSQFSPTFSAYLRFGTEPFHLKYSKFCIKKVNNVIKCPLKKAIKLFYFKTYYKYGDSRNAVLWA
jgi:hypothetical protein